MCRIANIGCFFRPWAVFDGPVALESLDFFIQGRGKCRTFCLEGMKSEASNKWFVVAVMACALPKNGLKASFIEAKGFSGPARETSCLTASASTRFRCSHGASDIKWPGPFQRQSWKPSQNLGLEHHKVSWNLLDSLDGIQLFSTSGNIWTSSRTDDYAPAGPGRISKYSWTFGSFRSHSVGIGGSLRPLLVPPLTSEMGFRVPTLQDLQDSAVNPILRATNAW